MRSPSKCLAYSRHLFYCCVESRHKSVCVLNVGSYKNHVLTLPLCFFACKMGTMPLAVWNPQMCHAVHVHISWQRVPSFPWETPHVCLSLKPCRSSGADQGKFPGQHPGESPLTPEGLWKPYLLITSNLGKKPSAFLHPWTSRTQSRSSLLFKLVQIGLESPSFHSQLRKVYKQVL